MPGTTFYQRLREKFGRLATPLYGCRIRRGAGTPWAMLHELRVENLLLMERAELRLAPD